MKRIFRNSVFFSVFIALSISFIACDSGGSSDEGPEWVGNWEVVAYDNGEAPDSSTYHAISQEEYEVITAESDGCSVLEGDITERDGNIVDVLFQGEEVDPDEQMIELRLEVSGNVLTATILGGSEEYEEQAGEEITLESIESNPRDLARCP